MKAWMKYAIIGLVLIAAGVLWIYKGDSFEEQLSQGFGHFVLWIVYAGLSAVSILAGLCILYELSEQWYQKRSGGVSWFYNSLNKARSWLGKDGF